jgi:hypothetical protein
MEPITAYDRLQKAGDIADKVLQKYNKPGDPMWEALLKISNERIEYDNTIGMEGQHETNQAQQTEA